MPHPYLTINRDAWITTSDALYQSIVKIATDDGMTREQIGAMSSQYSTIVGNFWGDIENATFGHIVRYINFYRIAPSGGVFDEFKNIYFLGKAILVHLNAAGLVDVARLHQRAMLRLLNFRLQFPYNAEREPLTERIRAAIEHGTIVEHFGEYGWYIIYKCLFNAAREARRENRGHSREV